MSDVVMPATFPDTDFQAFGLAGHTFFPAVGSEEAMLDPHEKVRQFQWSWQAVRYRYRSCAECNDEFKALLVKPSDMWKAGWGDEELTYEPERCIYVFFMSGLSIFDSFAFCLYFLGHALQPNAFPEVAHPRRITRKLTQQAFGCEFSQAAVTGLLSKLSQDTRFSTIDKVRNLVGHRISGRRSVRASSETQKDGTHTYWREETWHLPGAAGTLKFDTEMLQRLLDDIAGLLAALAAAAREFAENQQAAKAP